MLNEQQFQQRLFDPGPAVERPKQGGSPGPSSRPIEEHYDSGPLTTSMRHEDGWVNQKAITRRHGPGAGMPIRDVSGDAVDRYLSRSPGDAKRTEVPLKDVVTVQSEVNIARVNQLWHEPATGKGIDPEYPDDPPGPPSGIKDGDKVHLLDGNHRTTVAKLQNQMFQQIDVHHV